MAAAVAATRTSILGQLQQQELSIFKFSEPILSQIESDSHHTDARGQRSSDVSSSTTGNNPTPASLEADLAHYKELFTKLRFSYVEQVTKEKFLRSVVGDPPLYVSQSEITALESQLLGVKEQLQSRKIEVAGMVTELETQSRQLSQRWQDIQVKSEQALQLPDEIERLQREISNLREAQAALDGDGEGMNLPLGSTMELLGEKETEMEALDRELEELEEANERKEREVVRLEEELGSLQKQKLNATTAAKEARRRKEEGSGGTGDELEERGRWLRGVEATMKSLLEVEL